MSKPKLPRCNQEMFDKGTQVFMTHSMPATSVEEFVIKVREDLRQKVDWHYVGGRARVLALGDMGKVRDSLLRLSDGFRMGGLMPLQEQCLPTIDKG